MTASFGTNLGFASRLVNGILAIKPLWAIAKRQARLMMVKRAEKIGVPWQQEVEKLKTHDWQSELAVVQNPTVTYPEYYLSPFHAYDKGDLCWEAAWEQEVAAYTVHANIWKGSGAQGDAKLRQSYHDILTQQLAIQPQNILDVGCSVGLSSFALQKIYPHAQVTGLDLSPYFLAVANYNNKQRQANIKWVHAAAESTGLPDATFDLVSMFLICHELPQDATRQIFSELRRLVRPGGYLAIMDMNPQSEIYATMPAYILTLLKSTEPYLDDYFSLNIEKALVESGFNTPSITRNSPRHRTIVARVSD